MIKSFFLLFIISSFSYAQESFQGSCEPDSLDQLDEFIGDYQQITNEVSYKDLPSNCNHTNSTEYERKNVNPLSFEEYCKLNAKQMIERFCYLSGRVGQPNDGGLFGLQTGVCWWHSQFHRKMNYMTFYEPEDKKEINDDDFLALIKNIDKYKVTKIPGYKSFKDLVLDPKYPNRKNILKKFLQQEMGRGSLAFEWIHGFEGRPNRAHLGKGVEGQRKNQVKELEKMMKSLKNINPNKVKPVYTMVQYPFVVAHAFTVYDIESFKVDGLTNYRIRVQDSNYQDNKYLEQVYVFDNKSAQWFTNKAYKELEDARKNNKPYVIHREWTNRNPPVPQGAIKILSEQWTLHIQREKDNDKINLGFEEACGKKLFE